MATTTLTTGADTYNIYIKLDGALGAGTKTTQKGNLIDGGAGVDTLNIDDTYLGNYSLSATAAGVITITTQSGTVTATNFEKITFKNAGTINLGTAAADTINGTASGDSILYGLGGNDTINGLAGNDIMYGGDGNDTLDGGIGTDKMYGGLGDDIYIVDVAADTVTEVAGEGTDTVKTLLASYTLGANLENLEYTGTAAFTGTGNTLNNTITGGTGTSDTYVLTGTAANYTFTAIDATHTQITDSRGAAGDGTDIVIGIENIKFGTAAAVALSSLLVAPFTGTTGADSITGTTGADTMIGYTGDDTYTVDNAGDIVTEALNEGIDTVNASVNYTLAANVEKLNLTGAAITGTGNGLDNAITGNALNNTLDGGMGADTLDGGLGTDAMTGAAGDDAFIVDNIGDTAIEVAGGGIDTVKASVDFTLGAEVEKLIMLAGAVSGTGNSLDNTITGNAGNNNIDGGMGSNDVFVLTGNRTDYTYTVIDATTTRIVDNRAGGDGTDTISNIETVQFAGGVTYAVDVLRSNIISGTSGVDSLTGSAGNDTLDGGLGADAMSGLAGDDIYLVDDAGDTIVEIAGEGTADCVHASVDCTLSADVENLILLTGAVNGTGNSAVNSILGNDAANILNGMGGADVLAGGNGNDTYVVDNIGDTVTEALGAGTDTVQSSVTYTLALNVENLTLAAGGTALNGTGNALVNTIIGNSGANVLDGKVGADKMTGGLGNDTYFVDSALDVVTELAGGGTADRVKASVSYVVAAAANIEFVETANAALATVINLTGNALANTVTGNAGVNSLSGLLGNDVMSGLAGNDTLNGGLGLDTMTGGLGADTFVFNTALAATNIDKITDFNVVDTINLENSGTGLFNALALGTLSATAFWSAAGAVTAHDATDRIVYNSTTGDLFYDKDGLGGVAAIKFANLTTHPAITNADFVII